MVDAIALGVIGAIFAGLLLTPLVDGVFALGATVAPLGQRAFRR